MFELSIMNIKLSTCLLCLVLSKKGLKIYKCNFCYTFGVSLFIKISFILKDKKNKLNLPILIEIVIIIHLSFSKNDYNSLSSSYF